MPRPIGIRANTASRSVRSLQKHAPSPIAQPATLPENAAMIESGFVPLLAIIFGGVFESMLGILFYIVGSVWASARAINHTQGAATPLWLALIWLVPCIGAVLALIAIRKTPLPPLT